MKSLITIFSSYGCKTRSEAAFGAKYQYLHWPVHRVDHAYALDKQCGNSYVLDLTKQPWFAGVTCVSVALQGPPQRPTAPCALLEPTLVCLVSDETYRTVKSVTQMCSMGCELTPVEESIGIFKTLWNPSPRPQHDIDPRSYPAQPYHFHFQ